MKYLSFSQFERFFDYQINTVENVEKRVDRKSRIGKDAKVNVLLSFHTIYTKKGEVVVFAEVFDKRLSYGQVRQRSSSYNIQTMENKVDPFLQAKYPFITNFYRNEFLHQDFELNFSLNYINPAGMFAFGVDSIGNITFDNSLPTTQSDRGALVKLIDGLMVGDQIHFLYRFEDNLVFKSVPYTSAMVEEYFVPRNTSDEKILKRHSAYGGVDIWYNNYFIVWGYNRIKDKKGKRNILYIDKIAFGL